MGPWAPYGPIPLLQQCITQESEGDAEVDDQAGHVDERGDEGRRRAGGIEAESFEQEGKHRPGERPEGDDPHQCDADGRRKDRVMRTSAARGARASG